MTNNNYPPLKTILLDMDGVIWRGYEPVIDIKALFDKIHQLGCQPFCVTNNATSTVDGYLEKMRNFDVELSSDKIITSAEATGKYLEDHIEKGSSVYVIGEDGLKETITKYGFSITQDPEKEVPGAVVVGLDFNISYEKIYIAANLIRSGVLFVGTNPDKTFPYLDGVAPGGGSIISPVEAASGTAPVMIGKPEKYLFQLAMARSGSGPGETLMIGDRLETDILGAQQAGIRTALVLTGIASLEDAENWKPRPDMIGGTVLDILENL
jgi:4-nitrophenyl phosphatase